MKKPKPKLRLLFLFEFFVAIVAGALLYAIDPGGVFITPTPARTRTATATNTSTVTVTYTSPSTPMQTPKVAPTIRRTRTPTVTPTRTMIPPTATKNEGGNSSNSGKTVGFLAGPGHDE